MRLELYTLKNLRISATGSSVLGTLSGVALL
jgi:hypothetical protein